eukprot:4651891-Heterocapsa_arctica.AAC.1
MFIQEHKSVDQMAINTASSQWLKAGWKAVMGPGLLGDNGGASSGIAVMVRRNIPVDYIKGPAGNMTFTIAEGRATGCIVRHLVKGGLICISVYMEDGVGLSDGNWEVLLKTGE